MILEIARFDIKAGQEDAFLTAATGAVATVFRDAAGCRSLRLERCIEQPSRFYLLIEWNTLENHTVDFKASGRWATWRALVGDFFDGTPEVRHTQLAARGF
ncbi:MAG: antibiotic biosynthesis monooxygenase [Azospirillaceae bacterium]|nr:antibiotic biosynthesis monooxygenase [Azospirillaceae bacterium]